MRVVNISMLKIIILLVFSLFNLELSAKEWIITPSDLLSTTETASLSKRFPSVNNANELNMLIMAISRLDPLLNLEAYHEGNIIHIKGAKAKPIGEIQFKLTTRTFKTILQDRMHKYIGQVDSQEVRRKMQMEISEYLAERGFFKIKINLIPFTDENSTIYLFKIDEDYPCQISKIKTQFTLPRNIRIDLSVGDYCDKKIIEEAILKLEDELKKSGFNQTKVGKPEINFDQESNSAIVYIPGFLGKKVKYKVTSPNRQFWNNNLNTVDPLISDPDTIKAEISRNYIANGYDDIKIDPPKMLPSGKDETLYEFNIKPGPQYRISDVQIEGSSVFSEKECLSILNLTNILSVDAPLLNQDSLRDNLDALKASYSAKGYWDTKINTPRIIKDQYTGKVRLVIQIQEGKQRIFTDLVVQGNKLLQYDQIKDLLDMKPESPLIWKDLLNFEQNLKNTYHNNGYLFSTFKIDLMEKHTTRNIQVQIVLRITENNRVKFGDITITGLVNTKRIVVERELRFSAGEWFDPEKIEDTRKALINLGIFSSVSLIPSDSSSMYESNDTIPYTIVLREGKPGSITFGPGWSLDNGLRYGFESSYNNIGGLGRQVFLKAAFSEEKNQQSINKSAANKTLIGRTIGVGYIEPYVLGLPMNGAISLGHKAAATTFWEISRSGELSLDHTLRQYVIGGHLIGFYGQKIAEIESDRTTSIDLIESKDIRVGRVGLRFNLDRRNDISWPTKGYIMSSELSWARYPLGGNLKYFKWEVSNGRYFSLSDNVVFAARIALAAFEEVERLDHVNILPTTKRLNAGGAETNRGFRPQELG
ncbi:MAG: BamA/TamA family outer membrane protein, partial [Oligoflexales bacterium]|nr:BamA/TamA family outer membrane protein [Oligoflexales bacterium]